MLGRHVLVVERDDRDTGDDGPEVVEIGVVAHPVVGDDLGGRDVRALGEKSDAHAEADGGLLHHAGELTAPDDGQVGRVRHRFTLGERNPRRRLMVMGVTSPNPRRGRAGMRRQSNSAGSSASAVGWSTITRLLRATWRAGRPG